MHIAIEGFDGVGKTTICKMLAEKLNLKFVEKPLHYLLPYDNKIEAYRQIAKEVNEVLNRNFTAWFYGLSNMYLYEKFKNENIITDRHLVSNYCWSGTKNNLDVYKLLIEKMGKPDLTIILYAKAITICKRLRTRNQYDKDLKKTYLVAKSYDKMIYFCEIMKLNYVVIDTNNLSIDEVVKESLKRIGELNGNN